MIEQKPLRGVRVLDLSRVLAGPFCAMNLADLGAEVIKIEMPGRGDDSRGFAPRIPNSSDSGYYYSVNRGKSSVTIDLRTADGADILLDLARHCDVMVENFSPGTMDRFQLDGTVCAAPIRASSYARFQASVRPDRWPLRPPMTSLRKPLAVR